MREKMSSRKLLAPSNCIMSPACVDRAIIDGCPSGLLRAAGGVHGGRSVGARRVICRSRLLQVDFEVSATRSATRCCSLSRANALFCLGRARPPFAERTESCNFRRNVLDNGVCMIGPVSRVPNGLVTFVYFIFASNTREPSCIVIVVTRKCCRPVRILVIPTWDFFLFR